MKDKLVKDSETIMTELVMPNDTNPMGNLMGGNLMKWMDIAGSICASNHSEAQTVTVAVDNITFQKPIHLGDVVTIKAMVSRAFTTSVEIYIEVYATDVKGFNQRKCNHAYFSFVALNSETKKPTPVPKLIPLSDEEIKRCESAIRRKEIRLILAGKMQAKEATEVIEYFTNIKSGDLK